MRPARTPVQSIGGRDLRPIFSPHKMVSSANRCSVAVLRAWTSSPSSRPRVLSHSTPKVLHYGYGLRRELNHPVAQHEDNTQHAIATATANRQVSSATVQSANCKLHFSGLQTNGRIMDHMSIFRAAFVRPAAGDGRLPGRSVVGSLVSTHAGRLPAAKTALCGCPGRPEVGRSGNMASTVFNLSCNQQWRPILTGSD